MARLQEDSEAFVTFFVFFIFLLILHLFPILLPSDFNAKSAALLCHEYEAHVDTERDSDRLSHSERS